ncbi:3-deoxy-7-phosphoheptulonate synthase (plasmid) [Streptomyces sp. NBC_01260]|uniref:3-deoxy-7-phosphoheptulonate synthase n=2 Tax=unclassified Streptomyces TaxID=2593676 RepID=UPI000F972FFD|nr:MULTISPECIES: 3-deoxy-7-phosphoheptulonate synthase [unclassified Streptomyces]MCX4775214.1 3-deoxy-7-phosphoheptulonate synthase [Streptomyces sp. NBC_01285]ROQ65371.1 3-deoxy-D-arabinoheptulosonate-7-phosphate synthase [Streptomyces sp. CEV 2-1]RPK32933.1 Phospho-2-dehydro-3-deoxyheptonate aldolase [Streptomyces sp. ADI92-24]
MSAMPVASPVHDRGLPPLAATGVHPDLLVAAEQQPVWADPARAAAVRTELAARPGLVGWEEIQMLRMLMAEAAVGTYQIIQAGDCAEDPAECGPQAVNRKIGLIDALAGVMKINTGRPVIRIGRIAGQFAKPRSSPTEVVGGRELPVYRGHLVNGPAATPEARRADPDRMLTCYAAADRATTLLRQRTGAWMPPTGAPVWTSHEALVLDYERPLLRRAAGGQSYLSSTHLPWIGERTRDPAGSHVRLLAQVANPVACKVGPTMSAVELVDLCARLDPGREPGRLTLIARMGVDHVAARLPALVAAVREAGHPVSWLCDPMHGNTVKAPVGLKTRSVQTVIEEVVAFQQAVTGAGGIASGLHLETTPDDVTECVWSQVQSADVGQRYTTLCDPRLNPRQAVAVAGAWSAA